jgi:hypothetical protein
MLLELCPHLVVKETMADSESLMLVDSDWLLDTLSALPTLWSRDAVAKALHSCIYCTLSRGSYYYYYCYYFHILRSPKLEHTSYSPLPYMRIDSVARQRLPGAAKSPRLLEGY